MKALKIIGIGILVIVSLFFIIPLFTANDYSVTRSVSIEKDKGEVHDFMKHFSNFDRWSPWSKMDPDMKVEISGNDGEKGATYYWKGNDKVGEGTMEITDINENEIDILLTFKEPFEAESPTSYKLTDENGKTNVSWSMKGSMSYPWNFFMLFMDMEEAIGKDFENGLENLKKELK